MKKLMFSLLAMLMCVTASAHKFDGIDLNESAVKVMREISVKGYAYDSEKDCLKGNCQGTEIYLSFNLTDVNTKGKVGQLIVDIPMEKGYSFKNTAMIFNVIYHATATTANEVSYLVDEDGTTMTLTATENGVKMVYNTPYYKK